MWGGGGGGGGMENCHKSENFISHTCMVHSKIFPLQVVGFA